MKLRWCSACLASIMRLQLTVRDGKKHDITYNMVPIMLWTYVMHSPSHLRPSSLLIPKKNKRVAEITTGLICGCLPIMPQFVNYSFIKISSLTSRTRHSKILGRLGYSSDRSSLPTHERKTVPKRSSVLDLTASETALKLDKSSSSRECTLRFFFASFLYSSFGCLDE